MPSADSRNSAREEGLPRRPSTLKEKVFCTFHEILEIKQTRKLFASLLILYSFLQLMMMTTNPFLALPINSYFAQIISFMQITLLYPFAVNQGLAFNLTFLLLFMSFMGFILTGLIVVHKLEDESNMVLKEFENYLAFFYDVFDKVSASPIFGLCLMNIFGQTQIPSFSGNSLVLI